MFVLGTAGHIDHGKSELVKALTGIDPDRLREEKIRGMTIDLGFAWLKLPSGQEVGIVDVPGHERFIANMLAGVGGIDLVLLVVAANEGVMPQTREHTAIIDLLGINKGVVAITKKDMVDDELLSLVNMEIEELLAPTSLKGAPVVAVSSVTGDGIPALRNVIERLLGSVQPRQDIGRPRLPIDRIFTIAGSGTVVTGTLIDGSLEVGQEAEIVPPGIKTRIRGLQMHKVRTGKAGPGSRVAANLVGVTVSEINRGYVLTQPGWLKTTKLVSASLRLLSTAKSLKHNANVTFYSGAAESLAKIRFLEADTLNPGQVAWVQFVLDDAMAVVDGDHFIIRSTTETLGGGKIVEVHPLRARRFRPQVIERLKAREGGSPEDKIFALIESRHPIEPSFLVSQTGNLSPGDVDQAIKNLLGEGRVIELSQGDSRLLMTRPGWEGYIQKARETLKEYHKKFPLKVGMPREELHSRLKPGPSGMVIIQKMLAEGVIVEEGSEIRVPEHQIQLSAVQQTKIAAFLDALEINRYSPSAEPIELALINMLVQQGKIIKVGEGIFYNTDTYNEMLAKVIARLREHNKITLGEVRDMFQTSRKFAQAFLEYLDGKKITRRVGDDRILLNP